MDVCRFCGLTADTHTQIIADLANGTRIHGYICPGEPTGPAERFNFKVDPFVPVSTYRLLYAPPDAF